ncbi:hypothetical protein [Leptospira kanakyensis]|uniref:hypothetical protein n=1 Tax=Leptospira kanakyensis TaxID=2484968 RepID=UPI00223E1BA0|nr:hypothetical protein [Leptospira kanakyensis]MCW7471840.1 hypothetical protein [Leptospira kanakyensis]
MILNNKLEIAIHYLWFCQIDLSNIRLLNIIEQQKTGIKFTVLGDIIDTQTLNYDVKDRVNFPLLGTKDLLVFRLIYESLEKLFKASLIIENYVSNKETLEIKNGHSLINLWNNIPNELEFKDISVKVDIKSRLKNITEIEDFFKLDYNILRYGLDKNFEVKNTFTFEISKYNFDQLIDKIDSLCNSLAMGVYSSNFNIGDEPTDEQFPRVIIKNASGNRIKNKTEDSIIEITNKKRNCI